MSSNNGLRDNAIRLLNQLGELKNTLEKQRAEDLHVSCVNCDNWHQTEEYCIMYKQRPPAKIIAFGCPQWSNVDDDIPF